MTVRDDILILRVGGVVDDDGEQIAYTTRTLAYSSPPTQSASIRALSGALTQSVRVLEPLGAAGGLTVELVYGAEYVDRLTRQRIVSVRTSTNQIVRMTRPSTGTSILWLSGEPDLDEGDLFYVGGEAMTYGTWTAASVWTVGLGSASVGRAVAGTYVSSIGLSGAGTVLLSELPTIVGQPYTLSRVSSTSTTDADEVIVYRGYVDSVDPDGATVSISLGSAMTRLRDRQYVPPAPSEMDQGVELAWALTDDGIVPSTSAYGIAQTSIDALPEDVTNDPLLWLSLSRDGTEALLLVTGEWLDTYVDGVHTTRVSVADDSEALLMRIGDRILSASDAALALAYSWSVSSVQIADQVYASAADLGQVVNRMLTSPLDGPIGRRGGLPAAMVSTSDLITTLRDAAGVSSVSTPCYDGTERFVLPPMDRPTPLREVLASLLSPWGCSIASAGDGRIVAIDWMQPRDSLTSLVDTVDARAPWTRLRMGADAAIRAVTIDAVGEHGQQIRRTIASDIAMQISQGGEHITVDAGAWGPLWPSLQARWYGLLSEYQLSAPVCTIAVGVDVDLDVGDWCSLTASTMHAPDGTRGITGAAAVVTGRVERMDAPSLELTMSLVGWATAPNARRWAPAVRVASNSRDGSQDTVTPADYFDADEASHITAGDHVLLYDDVGNAVDTTPREVLAIVAGNLVCEAFSTVPVADDIIVLADYDDTEHREWAWMADSAGQLGSADDEGHTWR